MQKEEWKTINEINKYEISNTGIVRYIHNKTVITNQ